ncbi:hypothetical protein L6452_36739 [Arctium lappa]|uniref:Uncharacterized protein n=1 Tax=Arctium lappa TaxID=4217 RepID=A0ACB8Y1R1_ARCLA|nr:hypothetical protein L6452_36739 [Arctium lappa]
MSMFNKPAASLFFMLFVLVSGFSFKPRHQMTIFAQGRSLSIIPQQSTYAKVFDTLGIVCKCCDHPGEDCTSRWNGSCSNLRCIPWKFH